MTIYVVKDEHALGYMVGPDMMGVLASSHEALGSCWWINGAVSTFGAKIRPAKAADFDRFRVELPPDFHPDQRWPVRQLACTCCGNGFRGRQWQNQDRGFGLGACCVDFCLARATPDQGQTPEQWFERTYGIRGVHFDLKEG